MLRVQTTDSEELLINVDYIQSAKMLDDVIAITINDSEILVQKITTRHGDITGSEMFDYLTDKPEDISQNMRGIVEIHYDESVCHTHTKNDQVFLRERKDPHRLFGPYPKGSVFLALKKTED